MNPTKPFVSALALALMGILQGCAAEEVADEPAPTDDAAELGTVQSPLKQSRIVLGPTTICEPVAGLSSCPSDRQLMYCYKAGDRANGYYACAPSLTE